MSKSQWILLFVTVHAPIGDALSCDISGAQIFYRAAICYRNANKCFKTEGRVDVIGTKVLSYDSPHGTTGVLYELGKTIDLSSDPAQAGPALDSMIPGQTLKAFAKASYDGATLTLSLDQTAQDSSKRAVGRGGSVLRVEIIGCASCQVLEHSTYAWTVGRLQEESHMIKQECRIERK